MASSTNSFFKSPQTMSGSGKIQPNIKYNQKNSVIEDFPMQEQPSVCYWATNKYQPIGAIEIDPSLYQRQKDPMVQQLLEEFKNQKTTAKEEHKEKWMQRGDSPTKRLIGNPFPITFD